MRVSSTLNSSETFSARPRRRRHATNAYSRNTNTVRFERQQNKLGPISSMLMVGLLITIAGLLYLVQITKTSVYGFEAGELKNRQTELQAQNETLRVETARLQSLQRVEGSDLAKEFEPADDLTFLPE